MEINFKLYLESEEKDDIKKTIAKLPKKHQALLRGYKYKFQGGNTLKGDKENIGMIFNDKITVASPWRYGREYTFLHEIAHLIFEKLVDKNTRNEWSKLLKTTKPEQIKKIKTTGKNVEALKQNDEEIFCMVYAQAYADNPVVKYDHPEWVKFIKELS